MEVPNAVFWLLLDPDTERAVVCAPILGFLRGARADQLRSYFARMGYRATVVRRRE